MSWIRPAGGFIPPTTLGALRALEPLTRLGLCRIPHLAHANAAAPPRASPGFIWAHAASGGDVRALRPLLIGLRAALGAEGLMTVVTETGRLAAEEGRASGWVSAVAAAPVLQPGAASALGAMGPALLLVQRLELWPSLMAAARRHGIPVVLHGGRVSARSAGLYRALARLTPGLCDPIALGLMASEADRARMATIAEGLAGRLTLWPGSRLAAARPPRPDRVEALRRRFDLGPGRAVLVAGSLREGEMEAPLDGLEGRRLVMAPRRPHLAVACVEAARRRGLSAAPTSAPEAARRAQVIVVDAFGGLPDWYGVGAEAFVGGTLRPDVGGHNPVEAWAAGCPVVVGPHTSGIEDAIAALPAGVRRWSGRGAIWYGGGDVNHEALAAQALEIGAGQRRQAVEVVLAELGR